MNTPDSTQPVINPPASELVEFAISQSRAIFYISSIEDRAAGSSTEEARHFVSENITDLTGWDVWEFYDNRRFGWELMHPDDRGRYDAMLDRLEEVETGHETIRMKTASGGSTTSTATARPITTTASTRTSTSRRPSTPSTSTCSRMRAGG